MFIAVSTYNRPALTRLCLAQQIEAAGDAGEFHVWDDGSTDPPSTVGLDLASWRRSGKNIGPHRMRAKQIRSFLDSGEEVLYLTDADAILDPEALNKGLRILETERKHFPILSLYNSPLHAQYTVGTGRALHGDLMVARIFAPGISMMIHRESLEPVADEIEDALQDEWDFALPTLLGKSCLVTIRSYVDHLGAGGIHSGPNDWDRDRAVNPTRYLEQERKRILSKLKGEPAT